MFHPREKRLCRERDLSGPPRGARVTFEPAQLIREGLGTGPEFCVGNLGDIIWTRKTVTLLSKRRTDHQPYGAVMVSDPEKPGLSPLQLK